MEKVQKICEMPNNIFAKAHRFPNLRCCYLGSVKKKLKKPEFDKKCQQPKTNLFQRVVSSNENCFLWLQKNEKTKVEHFPYLSLMNILILKLRKQSCTQDLWQTNKSEMTSQKGKFQPFQKETGTNKVEITFAQVADYHCRKNLA